MGILREESTGAWRALLARTLVGRASRSDLVLDDPSVSSAHAVLSWSRGGWSVRDLGSRNGTSIDDVAVPHGGTCPLRAGAALCFGGARWVLESALAPSAHAVAGGAVVEAVGGVLALPEGEAPELLVYAQSGAWVVEVGDEVAPIRDRSRVRAGGRSWLVFLPVALVETQEAGPRLRVLGALTMVFSVSADEEHVDWRARAVGAPDIALGARSFNYALLTLARARLADAERPLGERGWRDRDALADDLGLDSESLRVYLYRARRHLAGAGVEGAARLIERRRGTGLIRFGVAAIEIAAL